jgi:hypothetical protein
MSQSLDSLARRAAAGTARATRRAALGASAAAAAAAGALWLPGGAGHALAAPTAQVAQALNAESIYFEETGHTVSGPFWRYWRQHGLDAFGYPITEAYEDGGVLNQYFQRARFELLPNGDVRLGLLGIEAGGAAPPDPAAPPVEGAQVVPETGHSVAGAFLGAYRQLRSLIGPPIGPELQVGPAAYVQYFAHARLEYDPASGVRRGLLGEEVAGARGLSQGRAPQPPGAVTFGDYLGALAVDAEERRAFAARATGNAAFMPAYGQKWVVVNLNQQRVYAYEHARQVFTDLISSGRSDKGLSTRGTFAINRRVANETMDSTTIGYPKGHPKYYRLENVLYTQYYNGGEALHYAWWHNNFGSPQSYGCINMRLSTARWFWDWASMGTPVIVV